MSGIEARHAAVRRQLVKRSAQTHALELADCSGEFLSQQLKTVKRFRHAIGYGHEKRSRRKVQPSFAIVALLVMQVTTLRVVHLALIVSPPGAMMHIVGCPVLQECFRMPSPMQEQLGVRCLPRK